MDDIKQARMNVEAAIEQAKIITKGWNNGISSSPSDEALIALARLILQDTYRLQDLERARRTAQTAMLSGSTKRPSILSCIPDDNYEVAEKASKHHGFVKLGDLEEVDDTEGKV